MCVLLLYFSDGMGYVLFYWHPTLCSIIFLLLGYRSRRALSETCHSIRGNGRINQSWGATIAHFVFPSSSQSYQTRRLHVWYRGIEAPARVLSNDPDVNAPSRRQCSRRTRKESTVSR
ncbi:unnamed protein product [Ascophyllum nodosum]